MICNDRLEIILGYFQLPGTKNLALNSLQKLITRRLFDWYMVSHRQRIHRLIDHHWLSFRLKFINCISMVSVIFLRPMDFNLLGIG